MSDDVPLLDDLMPWAVGSLRLGRGWVTAPEPSTLRARWTALAGAEGAERERLFRPTRARTPASGAAALPGQRSASTARFAEAPGPFPDPVRVLTAPFDEQWLLPDQRLIDRARPELWRVRDAHQLFVVETPEPLVTAHLPAGRLGRIRPLHRRPGAAEPNLAPGLLHLLGERLGGWVTPEDVLCWVLAAGRPGARGAYEVPLAADPERWRAGLELGQRLLTVQLRGARGGEPPRLPGGRRPYVRSAVTAWPQELSYDPDTETLGLGDGTISPVPPGAWEQESQGERVLESWFAARTAHRSDGVDGLEALGPGEWPQSWTSELLALVTSLALLADLAPERAAFEPGPSITASELEALGVLPPPRGARRPASVLDHREEGPGGQFALL
ncbi:MULTISPECIES: type ISP restriction/modification enzyme [unclassified Streptomyces]|uniref:type ISP restriction/modification enzyme n=1 Tax=unclassified Streptomyces TaxID=2593676 RepID=UPI003B6416A6